MIIKWDITIPALTGEKTRRAYVYLPNGYDEEPERRYPVMYMFDGHNLFFDGDATYGKSWGIGEYLDYTNTKLIIAAVECNHEGNGRLEEYSPINFKFGDTPIRGKGKKYMDWLVGEFKPYIDANFRTLADRQNTAIGGSSMGGLMTMYALAVYGKYFSRGAALSPSLWIGGGTPAFLQKARFGRPAQLYMDYGSREFGNHAGQRRIFADVVSDLIQKGVFVTARIVPYGTHCEASWQRQLPVFFNALGFEGE